MKNFNRNNKTIVAQHFDVVNIIIKVKMTVVHVATREHQTTIVLILIDR